MKQLFLTLVVLCFGFIGISQKLPEFKGEIVWGPEFPTGRYVFAPQLIGQDGKNLYLLRRMKRKLFIEKYNIAQVRMVKSREVKLEYAGNDLTLIQYFMFGAKPVLQTSSYDKDLNVTINYFQMFNPETLELSNPQEIGRNEIPETKGVMNKISMSNTNKDKFASKVLLSNDNELAYVAEPIFGDIDEKTKKSTVDGYTAKLFDNELNIIVETTFKLPYENYSINQTKIANSGLVYITAREKSISEEGGIRKKEVVNFGEWKVFVLEMESGEIRTIDLEMPDRQIKSYNFFIDDNDRLIVAGLTTQDDRGVSGCFYARYNADLKEEAMEFTQFEDDFITQGWSERSKEKFEKKNQKSIKSGEEGKKPTLYNYVLRELIQKTDGSTALLAEQYYVRVVTRTSYNNGVATTTTTYYYYYNDVIIINFDKSGSVDWKTVVDKYQVSINDHGYYSSFFTVLEGNDINIIYNDQESNLVDYESLSVKERKGMKRNTVVVRVLVNEEGEETREIMFDFEDKTMKLVPKQCEQSKGSEAFMYAAGKKGDKLGVIRWD